ncbi:hypothetical protein ACFL21_05475, partial [Patescibacteria group bacterium]
MSFSFKKLFICLITTFALSTLFATAASAATCYWVNALDNGVWASANNWSYETGGSGNDCAATSGYPDGDDIAYIDGGSANGAKSFTLPASLSVGEFRVTSGYSNTISTTAGGAYDFGDFILWGGTFNAPGSAGTINVSGDLDFSDGTGSGTYNYGQETLTFDGTSASDFDVNSSETFYSLTFNKTGTGTADRIYLDNGGGDTITVYSEGTFSATRGELMNATGSKIVVSAGADVSWGQNFDGGTGHIEFLTSHDFALPEATDVCWITLNNSGLVVYTGSSGVTVDFEGPVEIEDGTLKNDSNANLWFKNTVTIEDGTTNLLYVGGSSSTVTHSNDVTINGGTYYGETTTATGTDTINFSAGAALTVAGGTFDVSNADTVDLNDTSSLTMTSGIVEAPGGTNELFIAQNVNISGGTFNHNDGIVTLDSTYDTDLDVNGSITFYSLKFYKTGTGSDDDIDLFNPDTINVSNNLTLLDGELDGATGAKVLVQSGSTLAWPDSVFSGGDGILEIQTATGVTAPENGNGPHFLFNNGSFTMGTTDASGTSTLTLYGLEIDLGTFDNTSGANWTLSNDLVMDGGSILAGDSGTTATVTDTITLNSGTVDLENIAEFEVNGVATIQGGTLDGELATLVDFNSYSNSLIMTSGLFDFPAAT